MTISLNAGYCIEFRIKSPLIKKRLPTKTVDRRKLAFNPAVCCTGNSSLSLPAWHVSDLSLQKSFTVTSSWGFSPHSVLTPH